jgi:aspartyl-tRNA(Asn)/glutamyl-tRNA(Gln) amidotransferase subunit C
VGLTRQEVEHIALLCRLGLSDEELERMREQMSHILENFQVLQDVDTTDVPPTAHSLALTDVCRDDEVRPSLSQEEVLLNAPDAEDRQFRVKAVFED